ncbi:DUF479 domain-containing protein [Undibacterium sp. LX40W]|uniref:DUF479 domain-containing protein n=1 Tax=Undibacterium nitidum TaxID=2762298 RepID=A0A923HSN5_9BURK|nr:MULTISPECIES: ACP phosphodiesterase [Undibacterium]MBC3880404.1 DUF479 domain-containing protein [Undibacterium nitidum]MBC3890859.1 DUF479 domain-containing protein [Undibacterium sp. LX40W]
MNYLAHIYLARQSADAQFGALLGDFVKPGQDTHLGLEVQREIVLHRKVDSFTDAHVLNLEARRLFQDGRRRYAGILLDVFYDHVLAKHWHHYSDQQFEHFVQSFYAGLMQRSEFFPDNLQYAAPKMVEQDWISSYTEFEGVQIAIQRMSHRLSRNGHLLRDGLQDLELHYTQLSALFFEFFPQLESFVERERQFLISRQ